MDSAQTLLQSDATFNVGAVLICFVLTAIILLGGSARRNPLFRLPGPWYTAFTSLVLIYHEYYGNRRMYVHGLHSKYGRAVRLARNEVSFTGEAAINIIYGGSKGHEKPQLFELFKQQGRRYVQVDDYQPLRFAVRALNNNAEARQI